MTVMSPYDWSNSVAIEWNEAGGYAYQPGEVLARGDEAVAFVEALVSGATAEPLSQLIERLSEGVLSGDDVDSLASRLPFPMDILEWRTVSGVDNVTAVVRAARAAGHPVQPNHVLFADNYGCGEQCPPHPSLANDLAGLLGNPLRANPLRANPLRANPLRANPLRANPLRANTPPVNTAVPAEDPGIKRPNLPEMNEPPRVVIFDTGFADPAAHPVPYKDAVTAGTLFGTFEAPDTVPLGGDKFLDPAAGHGTFIAGMLDALSPGTPLTVRPVIGPMGNANENVLVASLVVELIQGGNAGTLQRTVFNISMSGYFIDAASFLAETVALVEAMGVVVVASAGNLASCRPTYPAAYPGVISVGALGPCGPAEFTNFGPWVRACAPGVDLLSTFFHFNGDNQPVNGVDVDAFTGWASWSGTSFSAPLVVAALINEMRLRGGTANEAVEAVIDAAHLARIPCLGTIVNL